MAPSFHTKASLSPLVIGVHGAANDRIRIVHVFLKVIHPVRHMGDAVEHLGEGSALLKFQILDLIVIDLTDPELGSS